MWHQDIDVVVIFVLTLCNKMSRDEKNDVQNVYIYTYIYTLVPESTTIPEASSGNLISTLPITLFFRPGGPALMLPKASRSNAEATGG